MAAFRALAAAALAASTLVTPILSAPDQIAVDAPRSPEEVRQELEKIKKGRTLSIIPALGTDNSDGATLFRVENASSFNLVVLLVGPTTQRFVVGPKGTRELAVEPGDYEIAVTVVGRDVPPFYGRQTIVRSMQFLHQFVVPAA